MLADVLMSPDLFNDIGMEVNRAQNENYRVLNIKLNFMADGSVRLVDLLVTRTSDSLPMSWKTIRDQLDSRPKPVLDVMAFLNLLHEAIPTPPGKAHVLQLKNVDKPDVPLLDLYLHLDVDGHTRIKIVTLEPADFALPLPKLVEDIVTIAWEDRVDKPGAEL